MMDYVALKTEIQTDPKGLGYAQKSDLEIADLMNTIGLSNEKVDRGLVQSYEIINNLVPAEVAALTADQKQHLLLITSAGSVDTKSANVRSVFSFLFGAGTTTRTNLVALLQRPASRAEVLGFGTLYHGDIAIALRGGY